MFKRQRTGSVVCASCGSLVGVNDDVCYSCGRRNPGLWGFGPMLRRFGNDLGFISLVVSGCAVLYVAMLLTTLYFGGNIMGNGLLGMLSPHPLISQMFGASGADPMFRQGHWWTILSAGWLHGSILHILLNMMWVRQLGPATADIYGPGRMVIIYTLSSASGFLLSSFLGAYAAIPFFSGAYYTLGASAPIFGLLGALVYYGRRGGSSMVQREAMGYAVGMFVMGILLPGVDNYAHAGGFAGGYLAGMWLDPLKRERIDHMIGAAVCVALTALAIIASILVFLWPLIMQMFGGPSAIVG